MPIRSLIHQFIYFTDRLVRSEEKQLNAEAADRVAAGGVVSPNNNHNHKHDNDVNDFAVDDALASRAQRSSVVGYVARTARVANVVDATRDTRFNAVIDAWGDYKTRSLLCIPIIDSNDGRVTGLLECLNKRVSKRQRGAKGDYSSFGDADVGGGGSFNDGVSDVSRQSTDVDGGGGGRDSTNSTATSALGVVVAVDGDADDDSGVAVFKGATFSRLDELLLAVIARSIQQNFALQSERVRFMRERMSRRLLFRAAGDLCSVSSLDVLFRWVLATDFFKRYRFQRRQFTMFIITCCELAQRMPFTLFIINTIIC
jgi:hypothetical protein